MSFARSIFLISLFAILFSNCSSTDTPYPSLKKQIAAINKKSIITPVRILDSTQIVDDLRFLSLDTCEGRGPGSEGHSAAVQRILLRMREAGLDSFDNSLQKIFNGIPVNRSNIGMNILGWIKGTEYPDKFLAITAHYDHEGIKNGETYYGASDNASGTASLLGLAKYFKQDPHSYSLIFIAFDREETGLEGARHFCNNLPVSIDHIKFNLNIDMIARNDKNEIFACGLYHYPHFIDYVNEVQQKTNARLLMGHDNGEGPDNWTARSDHYPFYLKKIPFIYIGVEDHPDLHRPTDTFDKIDLSIYMENCNLIATMIKMLDNRL